MKCERMRAARASTILYAASRFWPWFWHCTRYVGVWCGEEPGRVRRGKYPRAFELYGVTGT